MLVTLLLVLQASPISSSLAPRIPLSHATNSDPQTLVAINPGLIADLSILNRSMVTFTVNITNAPTINSFLVSIQYDHGVLLAQSLDYQHSVLAGLGATLYGDICVDGKLIAGVCQPFDGNGTTTVAILAAGGFTPAQTSGTLFSETFLVLGGSSYIHVNRAVLGNGTAVNGAPAQIPATTADGFFTNHSCSNTSTPRVCTAPVASFYVPTLRPTIGRVITFNATASMATNPGATITSYSWDFGDLHGIITSRPIEAYEYTQPGIYYLTLTVKDSYGTPASQTMPFAVSRVWLELDMVDLIADHYLSLNPGAVVHFNGAVMNLSTLNETAHVIVLVDNQTKLLDHTFPPLASSAEDQLPAFSWNTTGLAPKVYRVDAVVEPIRNSTTGQIIQNSTLNSVASVWVQLVAPLRQGSLSLDLIQATGLGIAVIIAIVVLGSRILASRRPRYGMEAESVV
jgi:PKD repeat protein